MNGGGWPARGSRMVRADDRRGMHRHARRLLKLRGELSGTVLSYIFGRMDPREWHYWLNDFAYFFSEGLN